jgi:fatty acid amide hydrolase 2
MKSAVEIAALIRNQEKTVSQVVDECIDQIESWNPKLNAIVETCYDEARVEAERKDKILRSMTDEERKVLPPLFGVPFTSKEMIANAGMKSTSGSIHHKDRMMEKDASVIERVRNAGAILVGTSNVPEVGFWFECDNVVYGATKNPYDTSRTCGGSSGGEGAIVGAGASGFGIGSDIGGSVRLPAAFCGVFGHKPSDRVVPLTGHFPLYRETAADTVGNKYPFTVVGPIARTTKDLELIFKLMIGPDGIDANIKTDFSLKPIIDSVDGMKIYCLPEPIIHGASETEIDIAQSIRHAGRYLKEMGALVEEADPRLLIRAFEFWTARAFTIETGTDFPGHLANSTGLSFSKEFSRILLGKRRYTFPALMTAFLDKFGKDLSEQESNIQALAELKRFLTQKLGSNGVLLMPVHPRTAPKLGATYTRPFDFAYTGVINALGFPSTAVPMGFSPEGLPLSLQVVAAENQDHLCLSVARMLEIGFGGWQPPPHE